MSKETDYLVKMYEKYCPTKEIEGITCFTKEGMEWFDSIIKLKRASEALDIIVQKGVNVDNLFNYVLNFSDSYDMYVENFNYGDGYFDLGREMLTKEEYYKVKEGIKKR